MPVVPFRHRTVVPAPAPAEPYYRNDPRAAPVVHLRSLSEIEQMYAYWGSDEAPKPR